MNVGLAFPSQKDVVEANLLHIILSHKEFDSRGDLHNHFPNNVVFFALKSLQPPLFNKKLNSFQTDQMVHF